MPGGRPSPLGMLAALLCGLLPATGASLVFEAYRAIQFDRGGSPLGSRKAHVAAAAAAAVGPSDLTVAIPARRRQFLVARLEDLSVSAIDTLLRSTAHGLLLLAPDGPALSKAPVLEAVRHLEGRLLSAPFDFPVYLARHPTAELEALYDTLSHAPAASWSPVRDTHLVAVQEHAVPAVHNVPVVSLQGTLRGQLQEGDTTSLAIVASYDTMGAFPGYPGADRHRSGPAALLELARLLHRLYAPAPAPHDVHFVLSGAGRHNYYGTRQWLQRAPPGVLEALDFALCLDSIAGPHLFLHASRRPKAAALLRLVESFTATAQRMGIPFTAVYKKTNLAAEEVAWEHEPFAYHKVAAFTLSDRPDPAPQFARGSTLDAPIDEATVLRNTAFIAEVLAQHLLPDKASGAEEVFVGRLAPSPSHIGSWLASLAGVPRSAPHLPADSPLYDTLDQGLRRYLTDVRRDNTSRPVDLRPDVRFYGFPAVQLHVHTGKPLLLDVLLFFAIAAYLATITVYCRGLQDVRTIATLLLHKAFGFAPPVLAPAAPPAAAATAKPKRL